MIRTLTLSAALIFAVFYTVMAGCSPDAVLAKLNVIQATIFLAIYWIIGSLPNGGGE